MQQPPPGPPEGSSEQPATPPEPMSPPPAPMMPPPGPSEPPPPMTPPPSQPMYGGGPGMAAASNAKAFTILAWVLFPPIGSFIFLFVGKDDPDVRFNAANATAIHGVMLVVAIVLRILAAALGIFALLLGIWYVIWFAVWLVGLILSIQSNGRRFSFPVLTDTLSGVIPAVENLAS